MPKQFRGGRIEIPVVRLHGAIMAGGSQFWPALNLAAFPPLLEKAFADKQAPALAISINSPGGSPVQARMIYQRIAFWPKNTARRCWYSSRMWQPLAVT